MRSELRDVIDNPGHYQMIRAESKAKQSRLGDRPHVGSRYFINVAGVDAARITRAGYVRFLKTRRVAGAGSVQIEVIEIIPPGDGRTVTEKMLDIEKATRRYKTWQAPRSTFSIRANGREWSFQGGLRKLRNYLVNFVPREQTRALAKQGHLTPEQAERFARERAAIMDRVSIIRWRHIGAGESIPDDDELDDELEDDDLNEDDEGDAW
jgi:hypothetical protein